MTTSSTKPKIHLHLNAPDTTIIHRAGILGLWMTLKQLEKRFPNPSQRFGELSWVLTPYSVSLNWTGQDEKVLDWLLKQAFQIDERGLISLTGLNPQSMPLINKIHIHQALTSTLLQYNRNITPVTRAYNVSGIKCKTTTPSFLLNLLVKMPSPGQFHLLLEGKVNSIDSVLLKVDNVEFRLSYKQLFSYISQSFSNKICNVKNHEWIKGYIPVFSYLYPGATVRHEAIKKYSQCQERTEYAFALLFLPLACHYLILSKGTNEQLKSSRNFPIQYLLVVPDPIHLDKSAQIRWRLNYTSYRELYVSSLGEAALSYYAKEISKNFSLHRCQVILYGKLMKTSQLRNPVDIQDFRVTKIALKNYRFAQRHLQTNKIIQIKNHFLVRVNLIQGMIADNLLRKNSLWKNWWITLKDKDSYREIRQQLKHDQQGLFTMFKNSDEITKAHNAFIDVIHEALKKIYAQIYQDNPDAATKKIERENENLKYKLLNCYKEETFRHLMAKLLSKAGTLSTLNENRRVILPILTGRMDWKEARDITLFALSSYPTQSNLSRATLVFFTFPLLVEDQLYRLAFILL